MSAEPEMVCILGPTATGKTGLAVALARKVGGEILSADSRQVYRRMDIGTGKDLEEYRTGGPPVPYHLIDIVEPGTEFNVFGFQGAFRAAYRDIRERGSFPVLCGGSGMYLDAVLTGYGLVEAPRNEALRTELSGLSATELRGRLARLRPLHNTTDIVDHERLVRAIEIGMAEKDGPVPEVDIPRTVVFGLTLGRDLLRERIGLRLHERLDAGLIEEVRGLLAGGISPEQLEFYGLEYRYVSRHLRGELNRNDMVQKLAGAIVQFAKRQEKWFRRMERRGTKIVWLNAREPRERLVARIRQDLGTGP